jgi:hypothetical protein
MKVVTTSVKESLIVLVIRKFPYVQIVYILCYIIIWYLFQYIQCNISIRFLLTFSLYLFYLDWNSALFIILNGTKEEHLDMLDGGIIQRLLEEKWKTFARVSMAAFLQT